MSAIFGVGIMNNTKTKSTDAAQLINLLDRLGKGAQRYGNDATGLALVSLDSSRVLKGGVKANEFLRASKYIKFITDMDIRSLYSIVGHCRSQYKGAATNNDNNQPFTLSSTIGTIEGRTLNYSDIYKYLRNLPRISQSESEPLIGLFNYYYMVRNFDLELAIQKSIREMVSICNAALVDNALPHILTLIRNGQRPISVVYYEDEGVVVYASNRDSIDEAAKFANMKTKGQEIELPANSSMFINLDEGRYAVKDIEGKV